MSWHRLCTVIPSGSTSQIWLHNRITWRNLKNPGALAISQSSKSTSLSGEAQALGLHKVPRVIQCAATALQLLVKLSSQQAWNHKDISSFTWVSPLDSEYIHFPWISLSVSDWIVNSLTVYGMRADKESLSRCHLISFCCSPFCPHVSLIYY